MNSHLWTRKSISVKQYSIVLLVLYYPSSVYITSVRSLCLHCWLTLDSAAGHTCTSGCRLVTTWAQQSSFSWHFRLIYMCGRYIDVTKSQILYIALIVLYHKYPWEMELLNVPKDIFWSLIGLFSRILNAFLSQICIYFTALVYSSRPVKCTTTCHQIISIETTQPK